jgi:type III secretion protein S
MLEQTLRAMALVLWLSLCPIVVGAVAGLAVSIIQALTQVQEQTLGFVVKLIAIAVALVLSVHFIGGEMYNFTFYLFNSFAQLTT